MPWQIVKLKKLKLKLSTGTEYDITPFNPPDLDNELYTELMANPLQLGNVSATGRWQYEGSDRYYQLAALGVGSLNIFDFFNSIPYQGYMDLYNPEIGHDRAYIRFTNGSGNYMSFTAKAYYFGNNQTLAPSSWTSSYRVDYQSSLVEPERMGIGFTYNPDNSNYGYFSMRSTKTYPGEIGGEAKNCYVDCNGNSNYAIVQACLSAIITGNIQPSGDSGNPYAGGGLNDEPVGGEDQNFEETSDVISEPTLPSSPATGSGFLTAYVPTFSEINDVADYLIDPSVLQALAGTVLKLSDVVIGLSIFPFTIAATGSKEVKLNLMGIHLTTGVTCHYSDSQFVNINMGSIEVKKYWDNCLDFDPYTRISIYLPYVGYVDLDTDEVMGREITVKYNVDIVTGCCLALIIVNGSVLYQYPGECSCQIPVTSVSFDNFLQSAVQLGITAASGARAVKGAAASVSEAGAGVLAAEGMADTRDALSDYNAARASFSGIKANVGDSLLGASVGAVLSAKGQYSHAGAMSSCAGILGTQKPFLIIKRPKQCMPEGYESIRGFPCNMKARLGDLAGYTEVSDIHLNIPNATVQEIVECEQFLKEGVYL